MVVSSLALSVLVSMAPSAKAEVLPLSRLRLYETGVGYFERRGKVGKRERLALPVPTAHLDDALKTLVVLGGGSGARVGGIAFSSAVSEGMARAMAGLPDAADGVAYVDLLRSLEGTRVAVRVAGKTIDGRLVDVEGPFTAPEPEADDAARKGPPPSPRYDLLLLGDDGELRRISTEDVSSVRPSDAAAADRLDVAAEALSDHTARQTQRLDIQVEAGGKLGLGYVAESPVWRTSYRVVLGTEPQRAALQGWALVHNDTDEDWRDVDIELVNGRPASFLYPLAAPRYARRELIEPEQALSTVPQLAKTTPDRMWLDGEIGESHGAAGLGLVGSGRGGGGTAAGTIGVGSYGTIGHGVGLGLGDLAELTKAQTEEQGALFVYRVSDPVDLDAHHSALLPVVSETIEAESITWFSAGQSDGLTGVRMVNTTKQTLPGGAVSFYAGGGFVGETILGRLKPGERRFVVYGAELDVETSRRWDAAGETTRAVHFVEGALTESFVAKDDVHVTIDNHSARSQRVYVGLDLPRNARLTTEDEAVELDFDLESSTPLIAVTVGSGRHSEHVVRAETAASRTHATDEDALTELLAHEGLPSDAEAVLREALKHRQDASRHVEAAARVRRELSDATDDLGRLREDLWALGSAGVRGRLREKLYREVLAKEESIVTLRSKRRAELRAARASERAVSATLERLD